MGDEEDSLSTWQSPCHKEPQEDTMSTPITGKATHQTSSLYPQSLQRQSFHHLIVPIANTNPKAYSWVHFQSFFCCKIGSLSLWTTHLVHRLTDLWTWKTTEDKTQRSPKWVHLRDKEPRGKEHEFSSRGRDYERAEKEIETRCWK